MFSLLSTTTLAEELSRIIHAYDYGIVPGSATIFVLDEQEGVGRLDLTLLEGVMVVVEVSDNGYMATSTSPLYSGTTALTTAARVHECLNQPFDSMEELLMTISPMFCERFQSLLQTNLSDTTSQDRSDVSQAQQQVLDMLATDATHIVPRGNTQPMAGFDGDVQAWIR